MTRPGDRLESDMQKLYLEAPQNNDENMTPNISHPGLARAAALAYSSGIPLTPPRTDSVQNAESAMSFAGPRARSRTQKISMKFHEDALSVERRESLRRFSVSTIWSMAKEQDLDVDDELTRRQKKLKDLKGKVSTQSKRNFLLERDVRYLDSRIALLIQNRMALDEDMVMPAEAEATEGVNSGVLDDKKKQGYGNLFFLLQTEPRLLAHLIRSLTLSEIDTLLQTVMFTLYGNQYDNREEHLLLTMFQSVLKSDIDGATDFGSLLRANTPVSRMMTTYTRRGPGQQYLKFVLDENIRRVLDDTSLNLEIDPIKVYTQMINDAETETGETSNMERNISADQASANTEVQKLIAQRSQLLNGIATSFLDIIFQSIDQVPYGIRWICKQIRDLTRSKYPDASDLSISSLIGGFFFLRFINPAIVTPESYMIVDSKPQKRPRRTLTLLAKMIQNLANKPSYSKEPFMAILNPFVEQNRTRISLFLNQLCEVDDFYGSLELEQYVAMSAKEITINISVNEIINTHALFQQHLEAICPSNLPDPKAGNRNTFTPEQSYQISCHQLKSIIFDLGNAPVQVPRKDNKSFTLQLFSKWELVPILFPHMLDTTRGKNAFEMPQMTESDILFMDTKALVVQIMRKQAVEIEADENYGNHHYLPAITITRVPRTYSDELINIVEILERACGFTKDQITMKRSLRARQNLRILEDRYHHPLVKHADGHRRLAREIYDEFIHLNQLLHRVSFELESLTGVYESICDHNQYLRSQLESYKAYLQNVRMQAGGGSAFSKRGVMIGVSSSNGSKKTTSALPKKHITGPFKFTHAQLEKNGVIEQSEVPDNRRSNIYFSMQSPLPGSFLVGLHYKGREKPIVEVDLKLDDLLEKQQDNIQHLDLEYVRLNVNKMLHLLNKTFLKK